MEDSKAKVYGIDLGTTYSVIARLDRNGMPEVIENTDEASRVCASAVYFQEDGGVVVGGEAKAAKISEPVRVVDLVKRYIGKPDAPTWEFNGEKYDPITVSALILKRMKEYADAQGEDVRDVVITCPAYFGNTEKMATKQAGEIAGLNVLDIINEPTAAALCYCEKDLGAQDNIMVYDLGGGTFDITLLDFKAEGIGKFTVDVKKSKGDDRLGGADWDKRLLNLMCRKYASEAGIDESDVDEDTRNLIDAEVEKTKIKLTAKPDHRVTIPGLDPFKVTRQEFEDATRDLVERTMDFVRQLLSDAKCAAGDINLVLLVGGSTRMPMIQAAVEGMFPGKVKVHDPDYAVAKGAAVFAKMQVGINISSDVIKQIEKIEDKAKTGEELTEEEKQLIGLDANASSSKEDIASALSNFKRQNDFSQPDGPEIKVVDKLSRSLGPGILNEKEEYVIDNLLFIEEVIPAKATETYYTPLDNMPEILIRVFENVVEKDKNRDKAYVVPCVDGAGKDQYTDPALKVKLIGDLHLQLPPNTPAGTPIRVTFQASAAGLEVTAVNVTTGDHVQTVIMSENLHSEEEIKEEKKRFANILTSGSV